MEPESHSSSTMVVARVKCLLRKTGLGGLKGYPAVFAFCGHTGKSAQSGQLLEAKPALTPALEPELCVCGFWTPKMRFVLVMLETLTEVITEHRTGTH